MRTVVVTGAGGQLGQAVVAAFAQQGDHLLLLDRDAHRLHALYGPDTPQRLSVGVDLLNTAGVAAAVAQGTACLGAPSVLCHLAGGFDMGAPVHTTTDALLNHLLDLNLRTLLPVSAAVVPHLLAAGRGHVVTVGAQGGVRGGAHMGAYAASKSALMRLTESMSAELRAQGVNVNCVLPSVLDTPANRAAMPGADPSTWVGPSALADVVVFLASHQARAIHGACLPVTGLA
jgi:NAD(P)-dependent dehydrogenase (short-subunit alcohol dehydrogenase family)